MRTLTSSLIRALLAFACGFAFAADPAPRRVENSAFPGTLAAAVAQPRDVYPVRSGPSTLSLNGSRHFKYVTGSELGAKDKGTGCLSLGGGAKGNGAKACGGLVRAIMAHKGYGADARHWAGAVSKEYRMILLAEGMEKLREEMDADGKLQVKVVRKGMKKEVSAEEVARLERRRDLRMRQMLRYRVRYFSDGVAIGSRGFVDGVFKACRERFSERRTSGARRMRGAGAAAAGVIWSARDLKVGVG